MAKTVQSADVPPDENADLKSAVCECISELERANKRMAERQVRIDSLKAETRAMMNELKAVSEATHETRSASGPT